MKPKGEYHYHHHFGKVNKLQYVVFLALHGDINPNPDSLAVVVTLLMFCGL